MNNKTGKDMYTPPYVSKPEQLSQEEREKEFGYQIEGVNLYSDRHQMQAELGKCSEFIDNKLRLIAPYRPYKAYPHIDSDGLMKRLSPRIDDILELDSRSAPLLTNVNLAQQGCGPLGPNLHRTIKKGEYMDPMDDPLMVKILAFLREEYISGMKRFVDSGESIFVKINYSSSVGWSGDIGENCGTDVETKLLLAAEIAKDVHFDLLVGDSPLFCGNRLQPDTAGKIRFGWVHSNERNDGTVTYMRTVHPFDQHSLRVRTVTAFPTLKNGALIVANQYVENGKSDFLKKVLVQTFEDITSTVKGKYLFCSDVPNNDQHMHPSVIDYTFDSILSPKLADRTKTMMRESTIIGGYTDLKDGAFGGLSEHLYKIERKEDDSFYQNFSGHGLTKHPNVFQNLGIQLWCHCKANNFEDPAQLIPLIMDDTICVLNNGDDCVDGHIDPEYIKLFRDISNTNPFAPRGEEPPSYSGKDFTLDGKGRAIGMEFPVSAIFLNSFNHERRPHHSILRSASYYGTAQRLEMAYEMDGGHPEVIAEAENLLLDVMGLSKSEFEQKVKEDITRIEEEQGRAFFIMRMMERLKLAGYPVSNSNELNWRYPHTLLKEIDSEAFEQLFIQYPAAYVDQPHLFLNI